MNVVYFLQWENNDGDKGNAVDESYISRTISINSLSEFNRFFKKVGIIEWFNRFIEILKEQIISEWNGSWKYQFSFRMNRKRRRGRPNPREPLASTPSNDQEVQSNLSEEGGRVGWFWTLLSAAFQMFSSLFAAELEPKDAHCQAEPFERLSRVLKPNPKGFQVKLFHLPHLQGLVLVGTPSVNCLHRRHLVHP